MKKALASSVASSLRTCAKTKDLNPGTEMHSHILQTPLLQAHPPLGCGSGIMFVNRGSPERSRSTFQTPPVRDTTAWNALITGYVRSGRSKAALQCFLRMRDEPMSPPDSITYSCILKACGNIESLAIGKEIHDEVVRKGMLGNDVVLATSLVDMYGKCHCMSKAEEIFDGLPRRNVVTWNALITGFVDDGQSNKALLCFKRMQREGISPDSVTFMCALRACGHTQDVQKGEAIHGEIAEKGLLGRDVMVGNCLIDMYAKCGALGKAEQVLKQLPVPNVVSWSALIAGYVLHGCSTEALACYERMCRLGISANSVTFVSLLKACANTMAITIGTQIHGEITQRSLLRNNIVLGTALVDMYVSCNELEKAQRVLCEFPYRDAVSWNAIIAGYAGRGQDEEAFDCFDKMQSEGVSPDAKTYESILKLCGITGSIEKGDEIYDKVFVQGFAETDVVLGTALVDMYAKCGALVRAQEVFRRLAGRDVVSWNALIAAYAQHGQGEEALNCLAGMQMEGLHPNTVTFRCILNACSRSGLVTEGEIYFVSMMQQYGIVQDVDHHACMLDLFGRAGNFDRVMTMIRRIPYGDCLLFWDAILGACQKWINVELGRVAFEQAIELDRRNAPSYILMKNIYSAASLHQDAQEVEAMRAKYCMGGIGS